MFYLDYLVERFQNCTRAEYDQEGSLEETQPHRHSNKHVQVVESHSQHKR